MYMANQLHERNRTTITLSKQNYERLKKFGSFGESFDDVLTKVLQQLTEQDRK
jgi:predicted CopG family antitoxin